MTDLDAGDFGSFFNDVHGHEPFPWQTRLVRQVMASDWPEVIDLPTGTGKTATLDVALFTLALDPMRFPRRVVFVIDRRIIVDQVYRRAERLADSIRAAKTPVLQAVKNRLAEIADGDLLGTAMIRGGIPIDNEWTHRPDQPWVVVSTVDQFGSRLLFRGYGVSKSMRPIHAGLAGNDCLVILDEVHLSRAFAETLAAVNGRPTDTPHPIPRRFTTVAMSATPAGSEHTVFRLTNEDLAASDVLRQRVQAKKRAVLRPIGRTRQQAHEAVPSAVSAILKAELPEGVHSVGVIVNRVRTAREVHRALLSAGYSVHLVTGRMRPLDRVAALEEIETIVDPDRRRDAGLEVVVATQAIEVGADFSFDALITECAPIDSLHQRFGRLDRRGSFESATGSPAQAWILGLKADLESSEPDPVYGEAARSTWEEAQTRFGESAFEVGPTTADLTNFPENCRAPVTQAPLLLDSHMQAWVQTNPEPIVQPSIEAFLHGLGNETDADVSIVWRYDRTTETLLLCPPRPAEFLPVPIWAARAFLAQQPEALVADVDANAGVTSDSQQEANVERWEGAEAGVEEVSVTEIRPGDVLLLDPSRGGLSSRNWDPESLDIVADLGDAAQWTYRRRITLRLDKRLFPDAPQVPNETFEGSIDDEIVAWLETLASPGEEWLEAASKELREQYGKTGFRREVVGDGPTRYFFLSAPYRQGDNPSGSRSTSIDVGTMDGSDERQSFTGTGTTLKNHLNGVGTRARDFAHRLGLPDSIADDLALAGRLHDLGKLDTRFQLQLVGGDEVALAMLEEPLAKSRPGAPRAWLFPKGMRHELLSVALVESAPTLISTANDPDLVLHLIGTHHGHGRPLPPVLEDPLPQQIDHSHDGQRIHTSTQLVDTPIALEMADRFWRLVDRYGPYGLAWLEAIFRLADHRQSAQEEARS